VVDTPKVVQPTVVVVDTPKVVQPIVVVVDTPKVVIVEPLKVDTPKVAVVDTPKVVPVAPSPIVSFETPKVTSDTAQTHTILLKGFVKDESTGRPLGVELVFALQGKEVGRTKSDPLTGAYHFDVQTGVEYTMEARHPYYLPRNVQVSTAVKDAVTGLSQDLVLAPVPIETGQTFILKNIYFDAGRAILKPESREELNRLYDLLASHPTLEIEIRGHTDDLGIDDQNLLLSENRAYAVMNYLKYKGVMGYRLNGKGMGETSPIGPNTTEEGRAMNRRVEFVVMRK
jgi:OmpA-OmpF porin, OOP family